MPRGYRDEDEGRDSCSLGKGRVITSTERALKVELEDHGDLWVPRSVVHEDSKISEDAERDDSGELLVFEWWAEKEGLA